MCTFKNLADLHIPAECENFPRINKNQNRKSLTHKAMATIKIRIVGIYFRKTVNIKKDAPITIKDVMDEYIRTSGGITEPEGLLYTKDAILNPEPGQGQFSLTGVAYNSSKPPATLSGRQPAPPAGIYSLFENYPPDAPVGLGWQSYVIGRDGKNRTATALGEGFKYFDATEVFDGEKIIWRMVGICRRPNFPAPTPVV
jgi:hypothetical protein